VVLTITGGRLVEKHYGAESVEPSKGRVRKVGLPPRFQIPFKSLPNETRGKVTFLTPTLPGSTGFNERMERSEGRIHNFRPDPNAVSRPFRNWLVPGGW
jgi:hypothetical protein